MCVCSETSTCSGQQLDRGADIAVVSQVTEYVNFSPTIMQRKRSCKCHRTKFKKTVGTGKQVSAIQVLVFVSFHGHKMEGQIWD